MDFQKYALFSWESKLQSLSLHAISQEKYIPNLIWSMAWSNFNMLWKNLLSIQTVWSVKFASIILFLMQKMLSVPLNIFFSVK